MKKILLATTILGMTAGFAAAQVSFKGEGKVGFAQNGTKEGGLSANTMANNGVDNTDPKKTIADNKTEIYNSFKLSVSAAGETDSGLTFGASSSITTGVTYDFGDEDGFEVAKSTLGSPTLFIAGEFGKIQFKQNGFKEFQDDNAEKYDVDYAGSFGGVSIGVRSDLNVVAGNANYNAGTLENPSTSGKSSVKLGYEVAGIKLGAAYDEVGDIWGISAGRAFGPITATVTLDDAEVSTLTLAYSAEGISASLKVESDDDWKVAAGYAANGITVAADTNQDDEWTATAGYDLGGGLSLEAGTNYTEDAFVGAKMSF